MLIIVLSALDHAEKSYTKKKGSLNFGGDISSITFNLKSIWMEIRSKCFSVIVSDNCSSNLNNKTI